MASLETNAGSCKVMIAAGGTGGHVFPALAVADLLQKQGAQVAWLGAPNSFEERHIKPLSIPFYALSMTQLRGQRWYQQAIVPFRLLQSVLQARYILKQFQPNVVLGMGGFVSAPAGLAARSLGIPLLLHEQNAVLGMSNRYLSKLATQLFLAFPDTTLLPQKRCPVEVIGNPIRQSMVYLPQQHRHSPLHILVLGGSQGAKAINEIIPAMVRKLHPQVNFSLWHQTGELTYEVTCHAYGDLLSEVKVTPFIDDIAAAYQWADLVIGRAGAMTLAEISQQGLASILIPYPFAVDDHQTQNARWLADKEAAILLPQTALSIDSLTTLIQSFIQNPEKCQVMGEKAAAQAQPEATNKLANACLKTSQVTVNAH